MSRGPGPTHEELIKSWGDARERPKNPKEGGSENQ